MKKYSQHKKPADGESRKLNSPVICYPNDTIKIPYWDNYQQARKELEKINEVTSCNKYIEDIYDFFSVFAA